MALDFRRLARQVGKHGQGRSQNRGRALQSVRLLRGILSHQGARAFLRLQLQGLPPAPRGGGGKVQRLRPVRHVLSRFRNFRLPPATARAIKGVRRCTLTRAASLPACTSLTAITPAARAPWPPVRASLPATPSRRPPKSWSVSPLVCPPWAASSSRWKTNSPPPSPCKARFGAEPRLSPSPPGPGSPS